MIALTLSGLFSLLVIVLVLFYQYLRKRFGQFKELNIPGPDPHWFYGNIREYVGKGPVKAHLEWTKKYGKNFGYYYGTRPVLVIGDADLLRQIQIKDFHNFINRPSSVPGGIVPGKVFNIHLLRARDLDWKNQRAVLTPSFTTGKMKLMVPIMKEAVDEFLAQIEERAKDGGDFDIYHMYKGLTLDVIGRAAFGIRTDVQKNKDDPFFLGMQDFFNDVSMTGLRLLTVCLPKLISIVHPLRVLAKCWSDNSGKTYLQELASKCQAIVKSRRRNPKNRRNDLLQLMVDAEMSYTDIAGLSSDALTIGDQTDMINTKSTKSEPIKGQKKIFYMTDEQVVSNTFLMLIAGYETTSSALGFTTFILVKYQDIQEKARKEVQEIFATDGLLDFNNVSRCKYLDQVLMESLRYYPPVASIAQREAVDDINYGDLLIPKGMCVELSMNIHRDPDYFSDPDTFDPERFSPENRKNVHPMAFQSFGAGPRNCIGMRFAMMEAKLALANILLKYRLIPGDRTEKIDPEMVYKILIINPKNGIFLKVLKI